MRKKRILILFPEGNLLYSPSTLNLYEVLAKEFDVTVFTFQNVGDKLKGKKVFSCKAHYGLKSKIYYKLHTLKMMIFKSANTMPLDFYKFINYKYLVNYLKQNTFDEIIAIDLFAFVAAQKHNSNIIFFSLELGDISLLKWMQQDKIKAVIIQSVERYNYLFANKNYKIFYIQNAPVYKELNNIVKTNDLIFSGTALKGFGIYSCIHFLKKYTNYTLTIKGAIQHGHERDLKENLILFFPDLLETKRLIISTDYLEDNEVTDYLKQFRIGFCFYDLRFDYINTFNYIHAPSGKLFKYYAAGVPVIATNIPGLRSVSDFKTGVLIDSPDPDSIYNAILEIESNYQEYSENCLKAAKHFSFDNAAQPLINFLVEN